MKRARRQCRTPTTSNVELLLTTPRAFVPEPSLTPFPMKDFAQPAVEETGSLERQPGSGRLSSLTPRMLAIVEEQMRRDDKTTAEQILILLRHNGYNVSLPTGHSALGWTFRGSAYCQMIREANKAKCLEFATRYLQKTLAEDGFSDVIYT